MNELNFEHQLLCNRQVFVEVVYDAEHNIITEVRSFKYGHELDKYAPRLGYSKKYLKISIFKGINMIGLDTNMFIPMF